jgi:hypothetical protein
MVYLIMLSTYCYYTDIAVTIDQIPVPLMYQSNNKTIIKQQHFIRTHIHRYLPISVCHRPEAIVCRSKRDNLVQLPQGVVNLLPDLEMLLWTGSSAVLARIRNIWTVYDVARILQLLVRAGGDPYAVDVEGGTVVMRAVSVADMGRSSGGRVPRVLGGKQHRPRHDPLA